MFEKLVFTDENGEEAEFFILEQTRVNGVNYLLVSDSVDGENEDEIALIVRDLSKDTDAEAVYEIVNDDEELEALSKIFNELLDDIDVE